MHDASTIQVLPRYVPHEDSLSMPKSFKTVKTVSLHRTIQVLTPLYSSLVILSLLTVSRNILNKNI